jgi:transcriptional regulator with XRE-family HTH domain
MPFAASKIREFRRKVGLTQTSLGTVLGVPQCTVGRWETGFSVPSAEHIGLMCDFGYVQGIRPDFFFPNFNPIPVLPESRLPVHPEAEQETVW